MLLYTTIYAQLSTGGSNSTVTDLPNVIPPSPTVANLMKFEEVPVDTYSGQPNISIPLFSKALDGGLGFSVSLNYNSSGIRVDERSSWTGTGWSLFVGGAISRTVMDSPDESKAPAQGEYISADIGTFHNGFYDRVKYFDDINSGNTIIDPQSIEYQKWEEFVWKSANGVQHYDYQPDLFQFNFMGYSGRFIIVNDNGKLKPSLLSSSQKVLIELEYDEDTFEISSFTVKAPNGYQFIFNVFEESFSTSRKRGMDLANNEIVDDINSFKEIKYRSSWHLSEVKSANGSSLCTFLYDSVLVSYSTPYSTESATLYSPDAPIFSKYLNSNSNSSYNASLLPPKRLSSWNSINVWSRKVKEVVFRDQTKLVIGLKDENHPEDNNSSGCILGKMQIFDVAGSLNKEFLFNYKTTKENRLFLMDIEEKAANLTLNYGLSYDNEEKLPGYGSLFKDKWGYYKAPEITATGLQFVDAEMVTTGVLTGISYPTGGVKEFKFEPNRFSFLGNTILDPKKNPENYEVFYAFTDSLLRHHPINSQVENSLIFEVSNDAEVSITLSGLTGSNQAKQNHYLEIIPSDNLLSKTIINDLAQRTHKVQLKKGTYSMRLNSRAYIPIELPEEISLKVSLNYEKYLGAINKQMKGAGIRIQEIKFFDNVERTKTTYHYPLSDEKVMKDYNLTSATGYSSGSFDGTLGTNRVALKSFNGVFCNSIESNGSGAELTLRVYVHKYFNGLQTSMTKGSYVGYKNVEIIKEDNGKSILTYTSPIDFPSYDSRFYNQDVLPSYYDVPVRDIDYKRGNLISSEVKNESGQTLTKTINHYDYELINSERYFFKYSSGTKCGVAKFYKTYNEYIIGNATGASSPCTGTSSGNLVPKPCGEPTDFVDIQPVYYDYGLPFMKESISESYFYDALGNEKKTTTNTTYAYSLNNYKPLKTTTTNSKGEIITSTTKYAHETNEGRLLFDHRITEPVEVETKKIISGTTITLSKQKSGYKVFRNNSYLLDSIHVGKGNQKLEPRVVYHNYDDYGNPTEVSKKDGTRIVYVWGYHQTKPIAKIEGISLSSLSTETIENLQRLSNLDKDRAFGYQGTEGKLREELDKLRTVSSLAKAQITTYTYDPLIGLTSITDPRGYVMYYEYDPLNRLELVKDASGNILEETKYNYKN